MAQKGLWNLGAMPKEEGDVIREYNAMHEENFLSSWLREDLVQKRGKKKEGEGVSQRKKGRKRKKERRKGNKLRERRERYGEG